ncbi:esterase [Mycobacterium sp.]|uniref:esterase n=1 Tax=Mycobacterium sp. TaxID=1785 RepID=UPI003BAD700F
MRFKLPLVVVAMVLFSCPGVAVAAPKSYCDELEGVKTEEACKILMTRPGYSIDINLPSFYPDQKLLTEYVKELRDKFLDQADSSETRAAPYELDVTSTTFESAVPPRGTESLVLKTYENVGGAVPKTSYKAFNWDQAYRKAITYDNVWKPDTDPLPTIFPIIQSELAKQMEQQVSIAPNVGLDPANYQNFAIKNDGLVFFFNPGELLPEAAGPIQVTVPRSAIDPMLA